MADNGQGNDIEIGGLGFKLAVSEERPYERATAQFRKEQFDSAPTVGDQSLTGWWTRGQLSFHKGAGVRYYEVLDGEGVLNRFKDCEGVDVFRPGQVSLAKALSEPGVAATDAVPGPQSGGGGAYALTATGVRYTSGAGATSIATSDGGIPTTITSSGSLYYVTNGTKIERQYVAADARVNHVTNPSFETDLAGWAWGSSPSGLSVNGNRTTGGGKYGGSTLYITYNSGWNNHSLWTETTASGLNIGTVYVASAWVKMAMDSSNVAEPPLTMTIAGASADTGSFRGGWFNLRATFTATATSHTLRFTQPSNMPDAANTDAIIVDAVMVTESPFTGDYFDGAQPGCSWQGTAHASKSNYVTASAGASTVRVTTTDAAWQRVWWAKGRLWAVDDSNRWYALADAVASVTSANAFWTSTNPSPAWSLTDSPGAVFISDGSDIFSITVSADGAVPTLSAPTTAARLPLGEQVVDLAFYLSNLVVVTTRGVRIAAVQDDRIVLGPLTIEGDFAKSARTGSFDALAYVAGRLKDRTGDVVLCAIDLASPNAGSLTYPWAPVTTLATGASSADGCVVDTWGRMYPWSAAALKVASVDELDTEGHVVTGFHRYGTLEKKSFVSALVRLKGSGEVDVYSVAEDDTETLVSTLDAAAGDESVALPQTPVERVALKFVLRRDGGDSTKGPELLGYQLKALPAPARQRMIRVPLLLQDIERANNGGTSSGYPGSAWERLSALEAMEASGATHDFTDYRTGETGKVFIESVEHRGTVGPGAKDSGFGGYVWLTLRKVA